MQKIPIEAKSLPSPSFVSRPLVIIRSLLKKALILMMRLDVMETWRDATHSDWVENEVARWNVATGTTRKRKNVFSSSYRLIYKKYYIQQ